MDDLITSRFAPLFETFPEAVIYLFGDQVAYANEGGMQLLEDERCPNDLLRALAEHPGDMLEAPLGALHYRVTVSACEGGQLLVLRPLPESEESEHPFSNSVYRIRECLSNLGSVQWRLQKIVEAQFISSEFTQALATQNRLIHQLLRLTRQAELTQELDTKTFPREEGFDLAKVCSGMAEETTWLADLAGVRFSYRSNTPALGFKGSKSLLTQMLLALVSNSIRAAGKDGFVEMGFHEEDGRILITLQDSGMGIPEDRMPTLFTNSVPEDVPRPGEGAGLGLYNAQRIAKLHDGVIIAQSGQNGGTCLVVSLPIIKPDSVPARNNPGYDNLGGYSPVLIELSDVLPWQAFVKKDTDT